MAIVTFMSDYGLEDHYVAAVKAAIIKINPELTIIDISHNISPFDIAHASYVLGSAFRQFPKGTVHLVAIDTAENSIERSIAVKLEDHYFVGSDSGIFSLISNQLPTYKVELGYANSTFIAKDTLAVTAANLASGHEIQNIGKEIHDEKRLMPRQPKVTKREIIGSVIRVDSYGNLISNIRKEDYFKIQELNGSVPILIQFGKNIVNKFHEHFSDVAPSEIYLIFNSENKLQIGINKGNAAELLGLRLDTPIFIEFRI